jgi:HAD superfamily hydrolase (TIGR01509 family)
MVQLQALIFDVDGTLAETERDGHRVAFNHAFAAAGLDWHWTTEQYRDLLEVAGGKERIRFYLDRHQPHFKPPQDLNDFIAKLHAAKTSHYTQLISEGLIPLRPGVKRLLQEARSQGIRLAIATTTTLENVVALLEKHLGPDAPNWFEVIAAGDVVPAKKPAPDVYLYTLQALALPQKACLAIEDSHQGLQSARQAGLPTIVSVNDYTRHHDFTGAALVLSHLGEPDLPFDVIQGNAGDAMYLDVNLAERLVEQWIVHQNG